MYLQQKTKNRKLAILFALILGFIGVHRFYIGDLILGAVYLVISVSGILFFHSIPAVIVIIISIIEAIQFGLMTDDEFNDYSELY